MAHRRTRRQELTNLFNRLQAEIVVDPRKSLAYVKSFSMPIKVTMIIGSESGIISKPAREQTTCQGDPRQNANLPLLCPRKEKISRPLPEAVKDDLYGLYVGILDGSECFCHFLDADAVVTNFAGLHEIIKNRENLRTVIKFGGWTMELKQVEGLDRQAPQATFYPRAQVLAAITFNRLARKTTTGLCGDNDLFLAPLLQFGDQALAAAVAINIGCIEEIDSRIDRSVQGCKSILL